ncbi:hypothetical protein HK101_002150 [Irineochytrium annulatum]|nr:hypothetical protein HK101_002150 [Irineochytrium annulatum]
MSGQKCRKDRGCEHQCTVRTSNSQKNPGKEYYCCPDHNFSHWVDDPEPRYPSQRPPKTPPKPKPAPTVSIRLSTPKREAPYGGFRLPPLDPVTPPWSDVKPQPSRADAPPVAAKKPFVPRKIGSTPTPSSSVVGSRASEELIDDFHVAASGKNGAIVRFAASPTPTPTADSSSAALRFNGRKRGRSSDEQDDHDDIPSAQKPRPDVTLHLEESADGLDFRSMGRSELEALARGLMVQRDGYKSKYEGLRKGVDRLKVEAERRNKFCGRCRANMTSPRPAASASVSATALASLHGERFEID